MDIKARVITEIGERCMDRRRSDDYAGRQGWARCYNRSTVGGYQEY